MTDPAATARIAPSSRLDRQGSRIIEEDQTIARYGTSWIDQARGVLDRIEATQADGMESAAVICAEAIGSGGLVHLFGSGHSRIPVEEMFPRYGSYPGWNPIVELSMTFHTQIVGANGQRQAMFIERVPGLAASILRNFSFGRADAMIVISASGLSAVPVEMAQGARDRGLPVIALTSVAQSLAGEVDERVGERLLDVADVVIDLCTPVGDAMCLIDGLDTPIGPGSTIANVAIVNTLKVRVAELLVERDAMLPVLTSAALVGAEASTRLFDAAYDEHGRRVSQVYAGGEAASRR